MGDSSCLSSRRSSVSGHSLASARSSVSTASTSTSLSARTPRGLKGSLSTVASRNLREFSQARCLIQKEVQSKPELIPSFEELERDLNGWNGTWKKKKAGELMKERMRLQMAEDIERKLAEEERRRKMEERQEWLRRAKEQEQKELQKEIERHRAKQRAVRAACTWQSFGRRMTEKEERLQQQLRQPSECGVCHGSGRCQRCGGEGVLAATYLASCVGGASERLRFHGRSSYGCSGCGGVRDGGDALGKAAASADAECCKHSLAGTGQCESCKGHGQIWPTLGEVLAREKREKLERQNVAE